MNGHGLVPFEAGGFRYAASNAADRDALARLISETFAREDPLALARGLEASEIGAYVRAVLRSPNVPALTIVAREKPTGELAGALLTEDASNPPLELLARSARFDALVALFATLAERLQEKPPPRPGRVLHLIMLAVDRRFAGRGIGQRLVAACLANGSTHGYVTAITEATGVVSQHIFTKLGFTTEAQVGYADFQPDRGAPFASIAEHGAIKAMTHEIPAAPRASDIHQR
jgi:ribosomal protein S18 acetylase RimI-like enzyme